MQYAEYLKIGDRMKIIIALLSVLLISNIAYANDINKHIQATTVISIAVYAQQRGHNVPKLRAMGTSLVVTNLVGLMKEWSDTRIDRKDLEANMIGSMLGISFVMFF